MRKAKRRVGVILLGMAILGSLLIVTTAPSRAEVGRPQRPPNSSTGSGKAEAAFDTQTKVLTYTITYAGLTGPAMGAHFHGPSEAGKNAGIALPFKTVQSPIQGSAR